MEFQNTVRLSEQLLPRIIKVMSSQIRVLACWSSLNFPITRPINSGMFTSFWRMTNRNGCSAWNETRASRLTGLSSAFDTADSVPCSAFWIAQHKFQYYYTVQYIDCYSVYYYTVQLQTGIQYIIILYNIETGIQYIKFWYIYCRLVYYIKFNHVIYIINTLFLKLTWFMSYPKYLLLNAENGLFWNEKSGWGLFNIFLSSFWESVTTHEDRRWAVCVSNY